MTRAKPVLMLHHPVNFWCVLAASLTWLRGLCSSQNVMMTRWMSKMPSMQELATIMGLGEIVSASSRDGVGGSSLVGSRIGRSSSAILA